MCVCMRLLSFFFFQAEDGIRDGHVTGVQTCALPIYSAASSRVNGPSFRGRPSIAVSATTPLRAEVTAAASVVFITEMGRPEIGRASCRERGEVGGGDGAVERERKAGMGDKRERGVNG